MAWGGAVKRPGVPDHEAVIGEKEKELSLVFHWLLGGYLISRTNCHSLLDRTAMHSKKSRC